MGATVKCVIDLVLFIVFLTASDGIYTMLCLSYTPCPAGACGVYEVNVVWVYVRVSEGEC